MVAIAHPQPHQLRLLDAPTSSVSTPAFTQAQVQRLVWYLRRMAFGDVLLCDDYRLERQLFQTVADDERDDAEDGALVATSYVQFIVFAQTAQARRRLGSLTSVVEVRTDKPRTLDALLWRLATVLLRRGWCLERTRFEAYGALTASDSRIAERARRLLKVKGDGYGG